MNEILTEYANKALVWLESGTAWIANEMPVYVTELIKWETTQCIITVVFDLAILIIAILFIKVVLKLNSKAMANKGHSGIYKGEWKLLFIPIGIISTIGIFALYFDVLQLFKVIVAPRVYLIEYFSNLVN